MFRQAPWLPLNNKLVRSLRQTKVVTRQVDLPNANLRMIRWLASKKNRNLSLSMIATTSPMLINQICRLLKANIVCIQQIVLTVMKIAKFALPATKTPKCSKLNLNMMRRSVTIGSCLRSPRTPYAQITLTRSLRSA